MKISASTNADALGRRVSNAIARQLPFATAKALTATAFDVRDEEKKEMLRIFDRPTPFTMNAFQVVPARKSTLVAEVTTKAPVGMGGFHYLRPQIEGGGRPMKRFERALLRADIGAGGFAAVIPARTATFDKYGNWSAGERNRVLSALQAQSDAWMNTTEASKRRKPGRGDIYVGKRGGTVGVFERKGEEDRLILVFLRRPPRYTPIFKFEDVAERTIAARYDIHFGIAMEHALNTAK